MALVGSAWKVLPKMQRLGGLIGSRMRSTGSGLKPKKPSHMSLRVYELYPVLAKVLGKKEASRAEMVKGVWDYIKENDLKTESSIFPDELLRGLAESKDIPWGNKDVMSLLTGNYNSENFRELTEDEFGRMYPDKVMLYKEYFDSLK